MAGFVSRFHAQKIPQERLVSFVGTRLADAGSNSALNFFPRATSVQVLDVGG
jgi:hypothetical protein